MTTLWQEWKAKNLAQQEAGIVRPSALLNPDSPKVSDEEHIKRITICESCPEYMATKQCSLCLCFMPTKTTLLHATCPAGKW